MAQRVIDLNRCLFQYPHTACSRCEQICPQQAIKNREIDPEACDDCGLCTAVCPVGAIQSGVDYDGQLSRTQRLTQQVLMCQKADMQGMPCLGALNRRLLWALADQQELLVDRSRCEVCNPAIAHWLQQELDACNAALTQAGKPVIRSVRVRDAARQQPARQVGRRSFFRSLFHSAAEGVESFTASQQQRQYRFDPVVWLEKQALHTGSVFPKVTIADGCTVCGLCAALCPEKALQITKDEDGVHVQFQQIRCTGCGVCRDNCPPGIVEMK